MRKLLALFLATFFCGCSNNQQKGSTQTVSFPTSTEQAPVEQKFITTIGTYDTTVNGSKRRTFINCSFYKQNEDIGAALAINIFTAAFRSVGARAIQISEQQQPVYVDTVIAELHTTAFEKTIKPLPPGQDKGVEKLIKLLLPDLFNYWRACNIPFRQKNIFCSYAGYPETQSLDTANALKIVMSGGIFYQYSGEMRWFVKNQFSAQSPINASFSNNGESNQHMKLTKVPPNQWMISGLSNDDIVIDIPNESKSEAIESACMEMTHRLIAAQCIKKMMEHLNAPPYYSNYEPVVKEYLRLNEVAVHYTMICFMEELSKKGLCSKKDIPNPFVQYNNSETYKGLVSLLKRYPPSLKNGMMVMRAFVKDPMNINKF